MQFHTKRGTCLEHKRLNKLVYVSYNKKVSNRFQKSESLVAKDKSNSQWDNEWVDENCEESTWTAVDEAIGAFENIQGHNLPRAVATRVAAFVSQMYTRKSPRTAVATTPDFINDEK